MRKYHSVDYQTFGKKVAQRRQELNLSQKEIADRIDCNESYLSKVENGKARPTFDFIVILTRELGVGVDYFLPHTKTGADFVRQDLYNKWKGCSPEIASFLDRVLDDAKQLEQDIVNRGRLY